MIAASPDRIWAILTDGAAYPEWEPNTVRIDRRIGLGEKLTAFSKLSPGRAFPVKVTEFVPGQKMTWTGGMPLGLFTGERSFVLVPRGDGATEFRSAKGALLDQGDTRLSDEDFRRIALAPYPPSIAAGVGSIMVSFSSLNGRKMHDALVKRSVDVLIDDVRQRHDRAMSFSATVDLKLRLGRHFSAP